MNEQESDANEFAARLAKLGIASHYSGVDGIERNAPPSTVLSLIEALGPSDRLSSPALAPVSGANDIRCFLPDFLQHDGAWGISAQLYELVSERNWGIGDFEDLKTLCQIAAKAGADFIGLNPLHALFVADPSRYSPYSPSNRLFLNPLYLAVDKVPGFHNSLIDERVLAELRESELVDYPSVSAVKLRVLRRIWDGWLTGAHADLPRSDFEAFKAEGGDPLRYHCEFECISLSMTANGYGSGWHTWPKDYRDCRSPTVRAFVARQRDNIAFCAWLQWVTARQLQAASEFALDCGLRIGLYLDFAVGEVPDGSATWSEPGSVLRGLHIGAPPDSFSVAGQDWGLVPMSPRVMATDGSYFHRLIDQTARFAGAIRLDHAMGLQQLFLIPSGSQPADGTYLHYPFSKMIESLAAVSQSRQTIVIGEDLGNVPTGFRAALRQAGILGYSVVYFEDAYIHRSRPEFPATPSLTCLSTHDLTPLVGWWRGDDIALAEQIAWIDTKAAAQLHIIRQSKKDDLLRNLENEGLIPPPNAEQLFTLDENLVVGLHLLLSMKGTMLTSLRFADMVGEDRPTNVPGTTDEYPNWRVKLRCPVVELSAAAIFQRIAALFNTVAG